MDRKTSAVKKKLSNVYKENGKGIGKTLPPSGSRA